MSDKNYKALVLDLDNTIYPEKDYLFQVYYLIGQFVEFQEGVSREQVTQFLVNEFMANGRDHIFDKMIAHFELPETYLENCFRLLRTAKIPLPLLIFEQMLLRLQEASEAGLQLFVLTNGHPEQQLNKIKHLEWHGLDQHIKCYFCNEIAPKPAPDAMLKLLADHQLLPSEVLFLGDANIDEACAMAAGVDFERVNFVNVIR
jgi:phosphoglycolate phosphatase-like HAD superfamily hydrolase